MTIHDFDKYYEAEEPGRRERAFAWATAIGFQDVEIGGRVVRLRVAKGA